MSISMTYLLNGSSVILERGSFSFTERLGSRSTGHMAMVTAVGASNVPVHGRLFQAKNGSTVIFYGRIKNPTRAQVSQGGARVRYEAEVAELSEAFDRRLVAASYTSQTLFAIVDDIVTNFLDGEGITTTGVETGPTLTISFNYKTVTDCFNELARRTGYSFWLDYDGTLNFKARTSNVAPTTVTELNAYDVSVTENGETYRNVQYVRGGLDLTSLQTENFKGDGTRRTFNTAYPLGKVPTSIKVNGGAAKTLGIRGVDPSGSYQWYWNLAVNEITQDDSETVLSTSDTVEIKYYGQFPILVVGTDDAEILARAAIESSSGRHEAIERDASIRATDVAIDKVVALLARYGMVADVVSFSTQVDGFRAGQLATITHTTLGLSGAQYLIESVTGRLVSPSRFEYTVTAVGGNAIGAWQEFFLKLQTAFNPDDEVIDEVLQLLRTQTDSVLCSDSTVVSTSSPESRIGYATIGYGEIG